MRTYYADDLYQICSKLEYRLPGCIVWLYYASSSIIWWFPDNFFFSCLVCGPLEKKKDFLHEKCLGELGALGEIIFTLARRMGQNMHEI